MKKNIYEMYTDNGFKFGFWVTRPKWQAGSKAQVVAIEGVIEGQPIPGSPPYHNKKVKGLKAGAPGTTRTVTLRRENWLEGESIISNGGTYSWALVDSED